MAAAIDPATYVERAMQTLGVTTPSALADVMGNRVSMLVSSSAPAIPLIQSRKLRALAIYGEKRIDSIPEVPTIGELGYKDSALTL